MTIHWQNLLDVILVSLGSTVAVTILVTVALLGLSSPSAQTRRSDAPFSPVAGVALAVPCLLGATAIVLFGLWVIVAR